MDKYKRPVDASGTSYPDDASIAAESVRNDFSELVALFDRHLDALADGDNRARKQISEARAAAERGLKLSHELIVLMRTAK
jgi:hypothetical protein